MDSTLIRSVRRVLFAAALTWMPNQALADFHICNNSGSRVGVAVGYKDADGYLYPSGRLRDTINRGGEKFGPIEVEEALRSHPAVSDVAVAGVSDDELGQRVGAAVVTRAPVTLEELRAHCRGLIAYFKLPERLAVVEDIPYNATGKVDRRRLAELITERS